MPIGALTSFNDGDVMSSSAIAGNFTTVRTFLNGGMILSDFDDGSIMSEHLRKPMVIPFPVSGIEGVLQAQYELRYGETNPFSVDGEWGPCPERVTLCPDSTDLATNRLWRTPIGRTFYHPGGDFRASLTANMLVRTDNDVYSYVSEPEGLGVQTTLGYFELRTYSRSSRIETVRTETRRDVYGTNASGWPPVDNLTMLLQTQLDAGIYDCYLVYRRGTFADATVIQIDLTSIIFLPEVW
jgi:hypothetical protein